MQYKIESILSVRRFCNVMKIRAVIDRSNALKMLSELDFLNDKDVKFSESSFNFSEKNDYEIHLIIGSFFRFSYNIKNIIVDYIENIKSSLLKFGVENVFMISKSTFNLDYILTHIKYTQTSGLVKFEYIKNILDKIWTKPILHITYISHINNSINNIFIKKDNFYDYIFIYYIILSHIVFECNLIIMVLESSISNIDCEIKILKRDYAKLLYRFKASITPNYNNSFLDNMFIRIS